MGRSTPKKGKNVLERKPMNITVAMLNPLTYSRASILLSRWILKIRRRMIPGINVRYIRPISGLRRTTSSPREPKPIRTYNES
jgi:hypothetical protein